MRAECLTVGLLAPLENSTGLKPDSKGYRVSLLKQTPFSWEPVSSSVRENNTWTERCIISTREEQPGSSPLKKLLIFRYPTLRRSTESLSRRVRTSSVKGSRLVSLSSSPLSRSLWRLDGLDLMPSGGGGFGLVGAKNKVKTQKSRTDLCEELRD